MNGISDQTPPKPDWQVALEHHEALCAERTERIYREIQLMREDTRDDFKTIREEIRELRTGQRWIIGIVAGAMLAWPPLLLAAIHLLA